MAEVIGEIPPWQTSPPSGVAPVLLQVAVGAADEEDLNPMLSDSACVDQP